MSDDPGTLREAARLVDAMNDRLRVTLCRCGEMCQARMELNAELATELRQRAIETELRGASRGQ